MTTATTTTATEIDHNYTLCVIGTETRVGFLSRVNMLFISSNYEASSYYTGLAHEFHQTLWWLTKAGEGHRAMLMAGVTSDSDAARFYNRLNAAARMVRDGKTLDEAFDAHYAA